MGAQMTISLLFRRQYLLYLDAIMQETIQSQSHINQLQFKYEQTIDELKFACKSKSAVPVDQVYPLFIVLASTWYSFYDELFLISFKRGIMETLQKSSSMFEITITPILRTLAEGFKTEIEPEIVSDQEIINNALVLMTEIGMINKNADIAHPGNTTQYFKLPVEFGSFCPTTLIKRQGMVVPGDKNIGLVRYKERLFTFSSVKAAMEFFKKPDQYNIV
jgi:hypothetical protein